uniref:Secreted protein n=1 Tax=Oryzias latipes TaxID=8090 RepID=A0A3P9MLR7_ORYLA
MQNLPVLWLAVGLQSLCHAPLPIVSQLKVQWQLVWAGPRVLLCFRYANMSSKTTYTSQHYLSKINI